MTKVSPATSAANAQVMNSRITRIGRKLTEPLPLIGKTPKLIKWLLRTSLPAPLLMAGSGVVIGAISNHSEITQAKLRMEILGPHGSDYRLIESFTISGDRANDSFPPGVKIAPKKFQIPRGVTISSDPAEFVNKPGLQAGSVLPLRNTGIKGNIFNYIVASERIVTVQNNQVVRLKFRPTGNPNEKAKRVVVFSNGFNGSLQLNALPYLLTMAQKAQEQKQSLDFVLIGLPGQDLSDIKGIVTERGKQVGLSPSIYRIENPGQTYRGALISSFSAISALYSPETNYTVIPLSASCLGGIEGAANVAKSNLTRSTKPGVVSVFPQSCYAGLAPQVNNFAFQDGFSQWLGHTFISPFVNWSSTGEFKSTPFASPFEVSSRNPPLNTVIAKIRSSDPSSGASQAEAISNLNWSVLSQTGLQNVNVTAAQTAWTSTLGEERVRFLSQVAPKINSQNLTNFQFRFIGSTGDRTANWELQQLLSSSLTSTRPLPPIGLPGNVHNLGRAPAEEFEQAVQAILDSLN